MNLEDNSIYVVPYSKKIDLLLDLSNEKELKNIKFYTIDEFRKLYTFSYDGRAIYYLMEKYDYKYSVAKEVLDSLIYIKDSNYKIIITRCINKFYFININSII